MTSLNGAAMGRVLRLGKDTSSLAQATVAVPEQEGALQCDFYCDNSLVVISDHLYAICQVGGPVELRTFELPSRQPIAGPTVSAVSTVDGLRTVAGGRVCFRRNSYTEPPTWEVWDPADHTTSAIAMRSISPVSFADIEVERHAAAS